MRTRLVPLVFFVFSMTAQAESTDLAGVYRLATQNDPQIGAAEAAFLARGEIVPQTRAGLLPSVVVSGGYSETSRSYPGVPEAIAPSSSFPTKTLQAGMNQPLFRLDRWYQYQQAKAIKAQAGAVLGGEELALIVRVAETYFTILERQDGLNAAMAEQNAVKRQLEQVQQRFDVGLVAITDVLESKAG
ncbi:MAG: TolC family protein, partial [Pseudomonadales bacterium]